MSEHRTKTGGETRSIREDQQAIRDEAEAGRDERHPDREGHAEPRPAQRGEEGWTEAEGARPTGVHAGDAGLLGGEAASFRQEWESIQAAFVDEPREAVERADALVARAAQRLADVFANERGRLEEQWGRGGEVSTEDLRLAFRRYRDFFDRLLSI